jgi:hypothetical protein
MTIVAVKGEAINNKETLVSWFKHFKLWFAHLLVFAILLFTIWHFYVSFPFIINNKDFDTLHFEIILLFNPITLGALYYYLFAYTLFLGEAIIFKRPIINRANILFILAITAILWQVLIVIMWASFNES